MKNLPTLNAMPRPGRQRTLKQRETWLKPLSAEGRSRDRRAFTLIELLVVITIILVLMAVTVTSFNFSVSADRMRSGARQVQSFLAGARDKAIYAKEIRGVRLLLDPNDNHSVNAVQYIGSSKRETGMLTFNAALLNNNSFNATNTYDPSGLTVALMPGSGVPWNILYNRGLLKGGCLIQIPANTGTWYTVSGYNPNSGFITLNRPNGDLAGSSSQYSFILQLAPAVLGDAQPVPLPRGVVIDLDGSNVPSQWRPSSFAGGSYSTQMDILFTPRGTVVGDAAGLGMLHLHFADIGDVTIWHTLGGRNTNPTTNTTGFSYLPYVPVDPSPLPANQKNVVTKDRILATLSTLTGSVSVHYVYTANTATPANPINSLDYQHLAFDPYVFAETGQVANK